MRRILKDKEAQSLTVQDINSMTSGSSMQIYLANANANNGYFLGHNGTSATSLATNSHICVQVRENAYQNHRFTSDDNYIFTLYNSNGTKLIFQDRTTTLTKVPTVTTETVVLENTYNNVTRYLGVNGTSITSTTNLSEAKFDVRYHWNMVYQNSSRRFMFYNPNSNRYIRYASNAFSLNTSGTSLYVNYTSNAFTIAGSSTSNFMYMSSNTALGRTTSTSASQRLWTVYQVSTLFPNCYDSTVQELTNLPTATTTNVLLRNTYNNTTRYLGITSSNSVTSTTDLNTALNSDYYHWNLVYNSSGRFNIQNAHSTNRYIRYQSNAFSISTSSTSLYVAYTANSGFRIMGSNGSNYMYMSGTSTLARNQNTAQYWNIFKPITDYFEGWGNCKSLTIEQANPSSTTNLLAGYKANQILTIREDCDNTPVYLNHGTSINDLNYTTDKTDYNTAWILLNVNP